MQEDLKESKYQKLKIDFSKVKPFKFMSPILCEKSSLVADSCNLNYKEIELITEYKDEINGSFS
jgi:hypothetical protein